MEVEEKYNDDVKSNQLSSPDKCSIVFSTTSSRFIRGPRPLPENRYRVGGRYDRRISDNHPTVYLTHTMNLSSCIQSDGNRIQGGVSHFYDVCVSLKGTWVDLRH